MSIQAAGDDDRRPPVSDVLEAAQHGLSLHPKRLPSWLFYDEHGSELFERICEQPEYYLTRSEIALLREHAQDIAMAIGADVRLVEYGSGHALKTRILLGAMLTPVSWVPVEISPEPLRLSVQRLSERFPQVPMQPLCADFSRPLRLPIPPRAPRRTVLYFPGSTIGNFDMRAAIALLRKMRDEMGDAGGILVGADLKKSAERLEAAYNDRAGVTAAFTLNMLARINRETGSDFDLAGFAHRARYNPMAGRIETHIVSLREQQVRLGRQLVRFHEGEAMLVEYSCKYSQEDFAALAGRAGLRIQQRWTDPEALFCLYYLVREGDTAMPYEDLPQSA